MSFNDSIYSQRLEKLKQIEALGQPVYRSRFDFTITPSEIVKKSKDCSAEELDSSRSSIRTAGRVMAIRLMGKAAFAHMQENGVRLQIYVKKDEVGEKGFELFKLVDIGDHIGVEGYLFRTRTGELSIHVKELFFLSKDLLPLPEKWHGLTDVELRYRQRYVDLVVNPDIRDVFVKRSRLVQSLRRSLDEKGFLEVETPMMQPIAGGAVARPFVTHHNALDVDLFLRIAPELYLKRLVVGGFDRVYEINRNFRNEGLGWRWNPEFTMLEFYQAYTDFQGVMDLTQELLTQAAIDVNGDAKSNWTVKSDGAEKVHEIDWRSWQRFTMRGAIQHYWPQAAGSAPEMADFSSNEQLRAICQRLTEAEIRVAHDPKEPAGKNVAAIFEAVSEEHLIQPTVIYEFPTAVSPLSKQKPDDPDWTERWEIYAGGMEIANGFSELNDPEDQRRRFEAQLAARDRGDEEAHQMDEDYIRALAYGMPPAGGVGVGVDRLAMLLTDSHTIRDVILFPVMRPESRPEESQD